MSILDDCGKMLSFMYVYHTVLPHLCVCVENMCDERMMKEMGQYNIVGMVWYVWLKGLSFYTFCR